MRRVLTSKELTWHVLAEPSPEELAEFVRESNLSPLDAEFIAQERQRPEVVARAGYVLILIQVPVFQRVERVTRGVNLYLVVREGIVSTLHFEPLVVLDSLYEELEKQAEQREEYFGATALPLALYLIRRLLSTAFDKLEKLNKHIEIAEDAVFHGNERKMVEEVALLTRDVMDFRRVIRPQRRLFYEAPTHALVQEDSREAWRRQAAQMAKLWDILESLAEAVKQLGKTNYALLQHKENQLLRVLTLYSILTIPIMILVDPFFSPRAVHASRVDVIVFWVLFIAAVGMLVATLWRFRGKRIF